MQLVLQELMEMEVTEQTGSGRYERTDARVTEHNWSRPRQVTAQAATTHMGTGRVTGARVA